MILSINFVKNNISEDSLGKINRKTFVMFSRFWSLRGGVGGGAESVKQGKFRTKLYFR